LGYLGEDRKSWRKHEAVALMEDGARVAALMIDQGGADRFLDDQLRPELLEAACSTAGIPLTINVRPGYDHSYYLIATFMDDHLRWHAERLRYSSDA
jgi:S-formylglutathione hydrolase